MAAAADITVTHFNRVESVRNRLTRLRLATRTESGRGGCEVGQIGTTERARIALLETALEKLEEALERLETEAVLV